MNAPLHRVALVLCGLIALATAPAPTGVTAHHAVSPNYPNQFILALASNLTTGAALSASTSIDPSQILFGTADITTDKGDYMPGEAVVITGVGWTPGNPVGLHIEESDGDLPWDAIAMADEAGNFINSDFVIQTHDIGVLFTLTATQGGNLAITQFTDVIGAGTASTGDTGGFEIQGGVIATSGGGKTDWIANGVGTTGLLTSPSGVPIDSTVTYRRVDAYNGSDDIFSGSHQINDNPNTYTWKTAGAGNKTDLNNVYVHISKDSNGDKWVIASADRLSNNGTSYVDFELSQASVTQVTDNGCSSGPCGHFATNPAGAVTGDPLFATGGRTPNDLLVTPQYNSGGSLATMIIFQWKQVSGVYQWVDITNAIPANTAYVATNTGNGVSVPYGAFGATTYSQNQYVEMAVNISTLMQVTVDPCVGIEIQTVFVRSKGSTTITAPIDDFVTPIPVSFNTGFVATSTPTNVSCNGGTDGTVNVTVTGGTAPYQVTLDGTTTHTVNASGGNTIFTGLSAGTHSVHVVATNGCTKDSTVSVTQPANALSASITAQTNVSCKGGSNGSATATPSGGTSPYSYSWNTSPVQTTATATGLSVGTYTVTVTDIKGCQTTAQATITEPVNALNASITAQTNVSCKGNATGSATVTPSGGTSPYTYSWNTTPAQTTATATGLAAGTYTATVTDNKGCQKTAQATITEPTNALSGQITAQTNVLCKGDSTGAATVTPSGGTSPYTYSWNTTPVQTAATATGLAAGTYTVTLTDNKGCQTTVQATITEPSKKLSVQVNLLNNVSCKGGSDGSAFASPMGGTGSYTYSWNTNPVQTTATATGLSAGTYTVTVTDQNGCQATKQANISEPLNALSAQVTAQTNVLCKGGSNGTATVTPSGGTSPYTFSWNTSPVQTTATATGLSAGTYTVTVTDNGGCQTTAQATISEPATALSAQITAQTNVACFGNVTGSATVTPSGGTSPYTFSWNTSPVQTTAAATGLAAGTYTVTVTDSTGCQTTAQATITQPASGLTVGISGQTNVACSGNSTGSATASPSGGTSPYTFSWNTVPVQTTATATGLAAGTYTVTVTDQSNCQASNQVTITQPASALGAQITAQTNVSCKGGATGSATVTPSGGTSPYTFSWNTIPAQTTATATGLGAGIYTVMVTDKNGCLTAAQATITEPANALAVQVTPTNPTSGNNGSASAVPSGGTAPYTFSWNTNPVQTTATASNLGAGTYIVTVTDSKGCQTSGQTTLTAPGAIQVNAQAGTIQQVGGTTTITLTVTGGTPGYTVCLVGGNCVQTNSVAAFTVPAGTYSFTITDAGGLSTSINNIVITAPQNQLREVNGTGDINGGTISFSINCQLPRKKGHEVFNYTDASAGITIRSTNTQITAIDSSHAILSGSAKLPKTKKKKGDSAGGRTMNFTVTVTDGSPDTLSISCTNGYYYGGTVTTGFIDVHLP